MAIVADKLRLQAVLAHHLHPPDSFHLYDEAARWLFSGDIGASILPEDMSNLFVMDVDRHIRYGRTFIAASWSSPEAKRLWRERADAMEIDMPWPNTARFIKMHWIVLSIGF